MDKEDAVYTYNGILSSREKNEIMPFAAIWMDLEIIILGEVNQRKTNTSITYMWNIKNDTNELIYKTEIDSLTQKTKLWLPKGKAGKK